MIRLFDQNIWSHKIVANRNECVVKAISRYDADVCAFQECRPSTHRTGDADIGALLAKKGYAEAMPEAADYNFTPVFYRKDRFDLIDCGYELYEGLNDSNSKSITWAVLDDRIDRCKFAVLSTHFWWKSACEEDFLQRIQNVHQLKACCDRIAVAHNVPILVAGDLNCGIHSAQGEEPYREMLRLGMRDVRLEAERTTDCLTHHDLPVLNEEGVFECHAEPVRTLDHIFAYGAEGMRLAAFHVLTEPFAMAASDHCPLLAEFAPVKEKREIVNFAHRGASEYAAENTMSSFYMGLAMGANGIETDVQITGDGVLVLFHDDTLARVTGMEGAVADYTYAELLQLRVRNSKTGAEDVIIRFEDFLRYFGWRDLTFAIELKLSGYEKEVLEMMDRFNMRDKSVITSFKFECIERVKALRPDYRVGWLMKDYSEEGNARLRAIGGEQMCPQTKYLTPEKVTAWRRAGFGVRAWGVSDETMMKHACACGVDGMTVNFPDRLTEYLGW